ncbi:MAG: hypothetical protein COA78_11055 [Blastopirellula sp.]|nr:MAG: hypothetical protein COA78_11055 [Blastopirellula sp.]
MVRHYIYSSHTIFSTLHTDVGNVSERISIPLRRVCKASWLLLKWTSFLVIVVAIAIGLYLYHNLNDEIRMRVEQQLNDAYPHLDVQVQSARFLKGQGIEIRDLSFSQRNVDGGTNNLFRVDELLVHCTTNAQELLQGEFAVSRVVVKRLRIHAVIEPDGSLNLASLFPLPECGESNAEIHIQDGFLEIRERNNPETHLLYDNVNLVIKTEMVPLDGDPNATHLVKRLRVEGSLNNTHLKSIAFQGFIEPDTRSLVLDGQVIGLNISEELAKRVPSQFSTQLKEIKHLQLNSDFDFHVEYFPRFQKTPQFRIAGSIVSGQWTEPTLPAPVTAVQGNFVVDQSGVQIGPITAKIGTGTLTLHRLNRVGWQENAPTHFKINASHILLQKDLVHLLPEKMQELWMKFQPAGLIDATLIADFDGQTWEPEVHITCIDTSSVFYKFPYPIKQTSGTIDLNQGVLSLNLTSMAGDTPIEITGSLKNLGPEAIGTVRIKSTRPGQLDPTMMDSIYAVAPKVHQVFESFHAEATANIDFHIHCTGEIGCVPTKHLVIDFVDGSVRFDKFPYPIQRIHGQIVWNGDQVLVKRLEGQNDSGHVVCTGSWQRSELDPRGFLDLHFVCKDVPLEDELREALPEATQAVWTELRPGGTIDHLDVQLQYPGIEQELDLRVELHKWQNEQNVAGRTITIVPMSFRYRLDDVQGSVVYDNGTVVLTDIKAHHGEVKIATSGRFLTLADGRWQLRFEQMNIEGLIPDRDLFSALPLPLETTLRKLRLNSTVNIRGTFVLTGSANQVHRPDIAWNVYTDIAGADINCGLPLKSVYGEVRLFGQSTQQGTYTYGELDDISMVYNDLMIRDIRGPFLIDSQQIILGSQVRQATGQSPRNITGSTLGGLVAVDAVSTFQPGQPFSMHLKLSNGSLEQALIDLGQQNPGQNTGRLAAELRLAGTSEGTHTLNGSGIVRLSDANLYELPVVVSLLKILRARAPDSTAFNSGEIDFDVKGKYVYLNRILLSGDAITLRGDGEATLSGDINMRFYSEFANNSFQIPIITPLLGEASKQLLVVRINGSLEHPETEQEIFPLVNETLEQLFPERTVGFPFSNPLIPTTR